MMELYYVGACTGGKIDLVSGDFCAENVETFLKNRWDYLTLGAIDDRTIVKSFRKTEEERKLTLQVLADTEAEFNRIMTDAHRVFEADVRNKRPGRVWCNGYYMDAYVIEDGHDAFDEMLCFVRKTVKMLVPFPFWTKEVKHSFVAVDEGSAGTADFPMDHPFDLGSDDGFEFLTVDAVGPSRFRMVVYGPCVDPVIMLGGHAYGFDGLTVGSGEYVVVDSRDKEAYMVATNGQRSNVFDYRDRDSYIFEPIPPGDVQVTRTRSVAFDLTIYDERGLPPWI